MTLNLYFNIVINLTEVKLFTIMNKVPLEMKDVNLGEDLVEWLLEDTEPSESLSQLYIRCSQNLNPKNCMEQSLCICCMDMDDGKGAKYYRN